MIVPMKHTFALLASLVIAAPAFAERIVEVNGRHVQLFPSRGRAGAHGGGPNQNVTYHNGPVIRSAKVVPIFWGPSATWGTAASPSALTQHIVGFFTQFGTSPQYNTITQYYDMSGGIALSSLTTTYVIDNTTPPTSVTDAIVQGEVAKVVAQLGGAAANTVYEVFLPASSYATYGSWNSCGGPNLQFCAYHSNFVSAGVDIKYASMPYPSCGGCQWSGWTTGQNFDHFSSHETREAVTDPDGTAWYDRQGAEADDKCAWSPSPFVVSGYGYQYEWSNLDRGCVQSR
jgi:hypothetical protein